MKMLGESWRGVARFGAAGRVRRGKVGMSRLGTADGARRVAAWLWHGTAGQVRPGMAERGVAWRGVALSARLGLAEQARLGK